MLLALGQFAAQEQQIGLVFLLRRERLGLAEGVFGILPAAQADIHLAESDPDNTVLGSVGEQALGQRDAFICLVLGGQFTGQHQLQIAVLGVGRNGLARDLDGLFELLGVAVGIHLSLEAAVCRLATHIHHLLVGGNRLLGLVLLQVDGAETPEEDAAIVLFLVGVRAIGMRREIHHCRVGLGGLVKATEHVEQQALVVASFKVGGVELAGLLDGGQRVFKLVLAALNFSDMHQRLWIL